jgi:outer membrane protein OmpA-like peptidoglycan-associated protein
MKTLHFFFGIVALMLMCGTAYGQLESFSQYDFVHGDQILLFEDFSQDAIGDFPALWTTNGSGEVQTISIAPGKWFHPTVKEKTTAFTNPIDFPENFIIEFDYISAATNKTDKNYHGYEISLYRSDKELDGGIFPGNQGLRLSFSYRQWFAIGYQSGWEGFNSSSNKSPLIDGVNHITIWIQKRRLRVYHRGEKVLDLPTVIGANTTFNRLRFYGYTDNRSGWEDTPFISNIKITTAAPDVRSKLLNEGKIISYGINFDSGKDVIKPQSYGAVKAIADVLKENTDVHVLVVGHTDSDGNAATNLDLSISRATSVKNCLVREFGIDASRIETDGKGQTEPLTSNNTPEGKAKNRRVEFLKINSGGNVNGSTQPSASSGGDIIGVWEIKNSAGTSMTYEFMPDGKLKLGTSSGVVEGTYRVDRDKLTMNLPGQKSGAADEAGTYKVNGNTLTITDPRGRVTALTKK